MLKLRVSYGTLGNNATSTFYMYQPLYASANYVLGNAVASGLAQTTLANPNLTWETTHMTNIGLDYGLFAHRLSGSVDVFNRLTTDILISLPAPLEHGTSAVPNQNAGKVRNRGIDFDISWFDHIGSMTYSLGFHMGYVRNKVTKFRGKSPLLTAFINCRKGNPSISYMSCLWTVLSAISPIWTMYSLWSIKIRTISPLIKDRNWATSCMQMRIMTGIWMPTTGSRSVTATPLIYFRR